MISGQQPGAAPGGAAEKKGKGCFFYGCLTAIVILLVIFVAGYFLVQKFADAVVEYTEAVPRQLPSVQVSPVEYLEVQEKILAFEEALDQGTAAELILDSKQINAAIQHEDDLQIFRNHLHVNIEGSEIGGELSLPLSEFKLKKFQDRYLNGSAKFSVSLQSGQLSVFLSDFEVKGEPLPEPVLSALQGKNLVDQAEISPEGQKAIDRLESVEIRDGKLIIRSRAVQ